MRPCDDINLTYNTRIYSFDFHSLCRCWWALSTLRRSLAWVCEPSLPEGATRRAAWVSPQWPLPWCIAASIDCVAVGVGCTKKIRELVFREKARTEVAAWWPSLPRACSLNQISTDSQLHYVHAYQTLPPLYLCNTWSHYKCCVLWQYYNDCVQ